MYWKIEYLLRWPVTGVFIVNETLNETRRNTQKLFSHHERNCSAKLFYKRQKTVRPSGEEGLVRGRATKEELEGLEYASTETEAATDCRYLDYDSNPAISAEVAAERGEPNPHKATKTN